MPVFYPCTSLMTGFFFTCLPLTLIEWFQWRSIYHSEKCVGLLFSALAEKGITLKAKRVESIACYRPIVDMHSRLIQYNIAQVQSTELKLTPHNQKSNIAFWFTNLFFTIKQNAFPSNVRSIFINCVYSGILFLDLTLH